LKNFQNLEPVGKIEAGAQKRWPRSCRLNSWLRILLAAELATQLAGEQIAFYHKRTRPLLDGRIVKLDKNI
jgi:hypothetical protein